MFNETEDAKCACAKWKLTLQFMLIFQKKQTSRNCITNGAEGLRNPNAKVDLWTKNGFC